MRYAEYIRSPKWAAVRKWALERADYRCQVCGGKSALHVHHRTYENLGHEHPGDVIVLCGACHELFHFPNDAPLVEQIEQLIALLSWKTLNDDEGPWVEKVLPLLQRIRNRARRDALHQRVYDALERLDPTQA